MKKLIKIYGERNTNTNYMSRLIRLNLDVRQVPGVVPRPVMMLQKILPGNEWVRDLYFSLTYRYNLGWKHTCVKPVSELRKYKIVARDLCFLTLTKSPYSWLLSLYRNPYHQYYKERPSFEDFLVTPWKTVRRDNCAQILSSPIELWNRKNSSYLQLAELDCLNITTESTFEDPGAVIEKISTRFSIYKLHDQFVDFEQPAKRTSKQTTGYYRDYYLNERWRDGLSRQAISIINASVDKQLMEHFGYVVLS